MTNFFHTSKKKKKLAFNRFSYRSDMLIDKNVQFQVRYSTL